MKYKILVADDDDRQILAYKNLFSPEDQSLFNDFENFFQSDAVDFDAASGQHLSEIELVSANQGEQAIKLVKQHLNEGFPVSVAFIDMRMPPGINGLETAIKIREVDPRIYIVIVTAYSDIDLREIARTLGNNVLFLRKPFQSEEIEQIAFNFANAWQKDESIRELQSKLKEKISINLLEASIFEMMNPILLTLADKVNAQAGLISYLQRNTQVQTDNKSEFMQVSDALTSEADDLSSMIKILQQLIHPTKEVMAFTVREAKNRFYSLIPELHHLPENISFTIDVHFDLDTTFHLPENYLLITVMALVRNSLEAVTSQLLQSASGSSRGIVKMEIDRVEDRVILTLEDNGIGIAPNRLEALQSIYREGGEAGEEFIGVGMSLVQEFVAYVGGQFKIDSEGIGKGVCIVLEFPISIMSNNVRS